MLSVFNSLTPYSYKTGGRIPRGWSYYTDSSGIHFNTSANLITPKGRYVSFWRTKVNCYTSGGGLVKVPASTKTITQCKTTKLTTNVERKVCLYGDINIRCSSENSNGCHGGIANSFIRANPTLPAPRGNSLPACCGSSSACPDCTTQDWENWRTEQNCLADTAEFCIYYNCCNHVCDRAIFEAVFYVPQKVLGYNSDGTPILSEGREETFLTANLNNLEDGGPRGPFCATIPKPTLASWSETKITYKTQCFTQQLTKAGYQYYLPRDVSCSDSEFALVIDVKDSGETLNATATYEGGFDAQPSGIVLYTSFSNTLPNPSPLGKALLNLYKGATIRRADWTSTKFIHNNNGFFTLVGGATMPTQDDIRAGDWQSFGQTADASALTCKSLDTYNEPKIAFAREAWSPSGRQYGDDAQPRVITASAGHNGRKIDGIRNKFAFNFTHTLPPSTKTRKLYTHILTEKIFDNKLSTLFAEEWQQAEGAENPASKVFFVYHTGGYLYPEEGANDATYNFNNDTLFQGSAISTEGAMEGSPYGHIWHNLKNNMMVTKPTDLPLNLYMPTIMSLYPDRSEVFDSEENETENARLMPFKREIPLQDVEIVKIYIHIPPRDVPTKLICSASSFISKVSEPNPPEDPED